MNLDMIRPPIVITQAVQLYKAGYSPIILVCGKPRVSKTSKAYLFAHWLSWLLFNKPWDWKDGTIIGVDNLLMKLKKGNPEGDIMLMDEVQRQLAKKKWAKPESQLMSDLIGSQAYKHYIIFLILPKAWELGTDHATYVNFVIPVHSKKLCQPYRVETPFWDISLMKKIPLKRPLGHFSFDYKQEPVRSAFAEELTHIDEFKKYIEVELKEKILDDAMEKRGIDIGFDAMNYQEKNTHKDFFIQKRPRW